MLKKRQLASGANRLRRILEPALVLLVFAGALWLLHRELKHITLADLREGVSHISRPRLAMAVCLTVLNYVILIGYDWLSVRSIKHPMPSRRVALASFIGYACSYNFGALLGGTTVRYRLYSMWGLSTVEILKLLVVLGVTFWVGFLALAGVVFLFQPLAIPPALHLPFSDARPIGVLLIGLVVAYLFLSAVRHKPIRVKQWEFSLPTPALSVSQIVVAASDLLVAAATLYVLLPPELSTSYLAFLGIYLLAILAVVFTHVPGGLGVFELVVLWCFSGTGSHLLVGSLLVFRLVYYLLPLLLAAILLVVVEVAAKWKRIERCARSFAAVAHESVPRIMTVLVFVAGVMLLFSGATPTPHGRLQVIRRLLPLPVIEVSHFLGSLTGILLVLLARGLQRRIETAYFATAGLLLAGVALSLLKGFDYEEAVLLSAMLLLFLPYRKYFYRKGALFTAYFSASWIFAVACVLLCSLWLMLFAYRHVEYKDELWWRFAFSGNAPRSLRAMAGAVCTVLVVAVARLLRSKPAMPALPTAGQLEVARRIVAASPRTSAQLALLGDKYLLFDRGQTAFIMYGSEGRSWVSLGDPVGDERAARDLAWDFRERCDEGGRWSVFYQVDEQRVAMYVEMGLTLFKLGEEARVPLSEFNLNDAKRKGLRKTHRQLTGEGCSLEIVEPPLDDELLSTLQGISDAWLSEKNVTEKGFSLGFFRPDYIRNGPVALVRHAGTIKAFANVWRGAGREELSIDLMRYSSEAPRSVMEFLIVELMLWGKEHGYRWFNLGMAPLSGVESQPLGPLWTRVASLTFRHGEHFYNFQGLRQYKDKFDPVWRPKYIASPDGFRLPMILTNVATLISGGLRGLLKR